MNVIVISSPEQIESLVNRSVYSALSQLKRELKLTPNTRKVSRKEAAKIEGISVSMLDKVRDKYVSELIGSKRVFLVQDGQLVKRANQ